MKYFIINILLIISLLYSQSNFIYYEKNSNVIIPYDGIFMSHQMAEKIVNTYEYHTNIITNNEKEIVYLYKKITNFTIITNKQYEIIKIVEKKSKWEDFMTKYDKFMYPASIITTAILSGIIVKKIND